MQKQHLLIAAGLILPLLGSCSEYRTAGYSKARVHMKTAPVSPTHQPAPAPAPRPQLRQSAPQVAPPQGAIPANLLAPLPAATPAPAPAPVQQSATQPSPQRTYPTMPGQNRRLKIR